MAVMTAIQLAEKLTNIAKNYKTIYVMGCFGAPITSANVQRYCTNNPYNRQATRTAMIKAVADKGYYGFDCVCLIKGVLWGWNGNINANYGGATYASNGVPDIGADTMITKCAGLSTDFTKLEVGEALWCSGHIGVYIGNGLAVECTPAWNNKVQITAVANIGAVKGYNSRRWTKHGKLPYVSYAKATTATEAVKKSVTEIAKEVLEGKWDNGEARKKKLKAAGYDYSKVQAEVNRLLLSDTTKEVEVGCIVKVKKGAKSYEGKSVASFVYNGSYTVDEIKGNRAVIDKKGICTAFNVSDLIVQ